MTENTPRIWQPETHPERKFFDDYQFQPPENHMSYERTRELIRSWDRLFMEKKITGFDFQRNLARHLVETLEFYSFWTPERAHAELQNIYNLYRGIFINGSWYNDKADWNFNKFKNGFLAEYASARALFYAGHQVYYPTEAEDRHLKVDWWVMPEQEKYIDGAVWALQVKCAGQKIIEPAIALPDSDEAKSIGQRVYGENYIKFLKASSAMNFHSGFYANVIPMFLFIPSGCYGPITGQPTDRFYKSVKDQVEKLYFPDGRPDYARE